MLALYTETLEELLKNKNYGEVSQDTFLTEILALMDKFPTFVFGNIEDSTTYISLSMKEMFIEKYDIREIGAESEELFMHFWREKCNELILKYVPKMQMWLDNFNDLFKFTVQLSYSNSGESSGDNQNTYYLNPVSNDTTKLKVSDVDKSENTGGFSNSGTRDVLQTVWGKTRADIMNKIFDVKNIFNDCLSEFETIFMGVL